MTVTDLWRDEGGYSANGCWVKRHTLEVPSSLKDAVIARRIKAVAGIQGMRKDQWCNADWAWRDGLIGAYADVV